MAINQKRRSTYKSRTARRSSLPRKLKTGEAGPPSALRDSRSRFRSKVGPKRSARRFSQGRRGWFASKRKTSAYWNPPTSFEGTLPEWQVHLWLIRNRIKGWDFQSSLLGGRLFLGGVVADFLFSPPEWTPSMVWRVQGEYFHFQSTQKQIEDILQRITLESRGFVVVDLLGNDIHENRDEVLNAALEGRQLFVTPFLD